MITARWKVKGLYAADANKVASEIDKIGPEITPRDVLEKARSKKTELHKCFCWDDSIAAEKYRLSQASNILRNLVIVRGEDKGTDNVPDIRVFYKAEGSRGYQNINLIVKDKDSYEALLERAYGELLAFKTKYAALSELNEIFEAISRL